MANKINVKSNENAQYDNSVKCVKDILKGETVIKENAAAYLPQDVNEDPKAWKARVRRASLLNYVEDTFFDILGKLIKNQITYDEDEMKKYPELVKTLENMDGNGSSLQTFVNKLISQTLVSGINSCTVNFNNGAFDSADETFTLKDQQSNMPVFKIYDTEDIYKVTKQTTGVDGYNLVILRNQKHSTRLSEDIGECEDYISESYIVFVQDGTITKVLNYPTMETDNGQDLQQPNITELVNTEIPISFLNFNNNTETELFNSKPPLKDLTDLTVKLFEKESDKEEALRYSLFSVLFATGVTDDDGIATDLKRFGVLELRNPQSKIGLLEPNGQAITNAQTSVNILKEDIEKVSRSFLDADNSTVYGKTQLQTMVEDNNANTLINYYAKEVERFLNKIFNIANGWGKPNYEPIDFKFVLNVDEKQKSSKENKDLALKLYTSGGLSLEGLYKILGTYDLFNEDFDIDLEISRIKEDQTANLISLDTAPDDDKR